MEGVSDQKQYNLSKPHEQQQDPSYITKPVSLKKIAIVASIGTGIQFGWALQFSLLTPYVQLLGIPHKWASYIWLCGPISGIIVQSIIGYQSDRCQSRFGRRRPFIAAGAFLILLGILLISFKVDFGHLFGDPVASPKAKPKSIVTFVTGFWVFDVANNMIQGPTRAFLADLAGEDQGRTRKVFALYSFFLAVGSVLGYGAGSFSHLYKFFPMTKTAACDVDCANLKSCFFISIFLLLTFTIFTLTFVFDKPLVGLVSALTSKDVEMVGSTSGSTTTENKAGDPTMRKEEIKHTIILIMSMREVRKTIQDIPREVWILVLVMCMNWMALCPFKFYDTDWMGREVYGGEVGDKEYSSGVRAGALGLMLNSVVFGGTSLGIDFLVRKVCGVRRLWGSVNFFLALCLGLTVLITKLAESSRSGGNGETHSTPLGIRLSALALFSLLVIPFGVSYSIPFALASIFTNSSGGGQGLTVGVLNLGIVVPQCQ